MSKTSKRFRQKVRPLVLEESWLEVQRVRRAGRAGRIGAFLLGIFIGMLGAAALMN